MFFQSFCHIIYIIGIRFVLFLIGITPKSNERRYHTMDALTGLLGDFDISAILEILMSLFDTIMSLLG